MGKASRRERKDKQERKTKVAPAPFVARPFEGLPGEADWVALREFVPAATATVDFRYADRSGQATIATVLPMAWPALHRATQDGGRVLIAMQSGGGSGDASRDLAAALIAGLDLEPGTPLTSVPRPTFDTPRLQDLVTSTTFEPTLYDGFDFWIEEGELDEDGKASLERANEAVAPTHRLLPDQSAYWCRVGDRSFVRWVLDADEDTATNALARLIAADEAGLGEGRLLGAFRASGLLVPVWEVDTTLEPDAIVDDFAAVAQRFDAHLADDAPLDAEQRRARDRLVSRQLTIR
ncbi:hypothetical protein ATK17_3429 [Branchiibius hedensis]|uniref:DUF5926 domain-containing protein n=1 Tax=Branchiibius hedensis TaxID=672460 RepID=A0A2Y9A0L9_9MICO|nr:DUF5926 family protein [Branchiibius hedensis]PWJ27238.1 hypothetical protein ATK17_3429 [Branchiibius hedensis]SSA36049.1 hypothetical protein SAMN04489750_3429 [Branchiibius hedensis]